MMRFTRPLGWLGMLGILSLLLSACSGDSTAEPEDADTEQVLPVSAGNVEGFDYDAFSDSTTIDNPYMPLEVGTKSVFEGFTIDDEGEEIPHRVESIVTDLVKVVDGVLCRVLLEIDISDGITEELELAFRAQDDTGTVWHMGEYREVYDETEFVGGRLWMQGTPAGALGGVIMPAVPEVDTPDFAQGFAPPPYNWTDRARVSEVGVSTTVETGRYEDVVVIEEFNDEEPGAIQTKYYAPAVGDVRIGWAGDDPNKEEMELVELVELSPEELAEARQQARDIEARALSYARTSPLEQQR